MSKRVLRLLCVLSCTNPVCAPAELSRSSDYSRRSTPQSSLAPSAHADSVSVRSALAAGAAPAAAEQPRARQPGAGGAGGAAARQPPAAAEAYDADGFLLDSADSSRQVRGRHVRQKRHCPPALRGCLGEPDAHTC